MKSGLSLTCAVVVVAFSGCGSELEEFFRQWHIGNGQCAARCSPPPGCRFEGMITEGPCGSLTCGELICDVDGGEPSYCAIGCAAPPPGCHFEGAVTSGPCSTLTCGTVVCDVDAGEAQCAISCEAPPPDCYLEGQLLEGPCSQVTCGRLVCLP